MSRDVARCQRRGGAVGLGRLGEEVEVTVPSGEKFYLIEKIEFI